jgi:hypothetical protein
MLCGAVVLTVGQSDSSEPAVMVMVVVALDIDGYFLHVVVMDGVHRIWHVYDVMFAVTCSIQQSSSTG